MRDDEALLLDLNSEQKKAVTHTAGPLLIVAGAGTGKTTVITRRIAWLIASKLCAIDEMLALTFTKKAAQEMEERVDRLLPYGYVDVWMCTFHSFCERILRRHGLDIGLPANFKLFDQTASWMCMRKNLDSFGLEYYRPAGNPTACIHELLKHFSRCKDEGVGTTEYTAYAHSFESGDSVEKARVNELAHAYATYQQLLLDSSALDFGDLILSTLKLFRDRPVILKRYQQQFKAILVDEFQDTNSAQYDLIKLLSAGQAYLTVVGDDDQSIYRWRGTSLANIASFKNDYPSNTEIVLTQNYRSRQNILDCAYAFIQKNNPNRLEYQLQQSDKKLSKKLHAQQEGLGIIHYIHCATHDQEIESVMQKIGELKAQSDIISWSDFAILIRSNESANPFIAACNQSGIPYHFFGQKGLFVKSAVIDLLSYCTLLNNYHESAALYRVLTFPFLTISHDAVVCLSHFAHRKGYSLWQALEHMDEIDELNKEQKEALLLVRNRIQQHAALSRSKTAMETFLHIVQDTGYLAWLGKDDTLEKREHLGYMNQLLTKLKVFQSDIPSARLHEFMDSIRLEQESGDAGSLAVDIDTGPDAVRIMTIHGSKGLEFRYVFIVHMIDRRFPTAERDDAIEVPQALVLPVVSQGDVHLEEERRLLYVALTRAKDGVFFTSASDYGSTRSRKPSRFLVECGLIPSSDPVALAPLVLRVDPPVEKPQTTMPLPSTISFSQLRAFQTCPLQYKYAFLLKVPTFGRYQFSFGKSIHAALERIVTSIKETHSVPTIEIALDIYKECWINEWYRSQTEKDEYYAKGSEILKRIHKELTESIPVPLSIEQEFTLKIGDGSSAIVLKGKIDRIDAVEDGVEIIDYKTGINKLQDHLRFENKEQLIIYQIAVEQLLGMQPVRLTYYYVEDGSRVSFLGTAKEKEKVIATIKETTQSMKTSDFAATPGFHCRFCDFKSICEYKKM